MSKHEYHYLKVNQDGLQWNLRTMDTLGTSVLSIVGSLYLLWRFYITCIQLLAGGTQFVHCREVVRSSEYPLSEVPL